MFSYSEVVGSIRNARTRVVQVSDAALDAVTSEKAREMPRDQGIHAPLRRKDGSPVRDPIAWRTGDDTDHEREIVAAYARGLVRKGRADWNILHNGDIELRLKNGQIFHLCGDGVRRVA